MKKHNQIQTLNKSHGSDWDSSYNYFIVEQPRHNLGSDIEY